jgi:hypothetical protein
MARLNEPPIAPAPNPLLAATIGAESVDACEFDLKSFEISRTTEIECSTRDAHEIEGGEGETTC